jgi:hypothetical protein
VPRLKKGIILFGDVVSETLKFLPPTVPEFRKLTNYAAVPSLRREPRVNAQGLKARRSKANRKRESWVDVQTITFEKEISRFGKF